MKIDAVITLSDTAVAQLKKLMRDEGDKDLKLRIGVSGGGCSGFQYGITLEKSAENDDIEMDISGLQVIVDPMSYQYLVGAAVDYTEGLEGAQFTIKNPNAVTTCGCGSSFSA